MNYCTQQVLDKVLGEAASNPAGALAATYDRPGDKTFVDHRYFCLARVYQRCGLVVEMYWEMYRRPQMIRFGKFELPFSAKPVSQPFRRIFPIPQETMDVTKSFTQNFGYEL